PFETGDLSRVARIRERVLDHEDHDPIPFGVALAHDPSAHAGRLLPVEVAWIVPRHEVAQSADVGAAPSPARMRPAAPRVLGWRFRNGGGLGRRIDEDLSLDPSPAVFSEETQRKAREDARIGSTNDSAAWIDSFDDHLAPLSRFQRIDPERSRHAFMEKKDYLRGRLEPILERQPQESGARCDDLADGRD